MGQNLLYCSAPIVPMGAHITWIRLLKIKMNCFSFCPTIKHVNHSNIKMAVVRDDAVRV
jgi:hypothetical protein